MFDKNRYLKNIIESDALASHKMAFVSGPRQVGKTTLGNSLVLKEENIFSWEDPIFRNDWIANPKESVANRQAGPVLLDEIHKDPNWKQNLKGLYDLKGKSIPIIVTGSARLDVFRKGGDSLMGRFFPYHVHPFTIGEQENPNSPSDFLQIKGSLNFPLNDILNLSGFPEPLFDASAAKAKRWSRLRSERLVNEDIRDIMAIQSLRSLANLLSLLPERVGSLLSINNLRETLQVSHGSVSSWLQVFESLFVLFYVRPWSKKLTRMVTAEPKFYLFDSIPIKNTGAKTENIVACHLLKACHYWTDTAQGHFELFFLRNKDMLEVDFLITNEGDPWCLVEVKSGQLTPCKNLVTFAEALGVKHRFQLVSKVGYDKLFAEHNIRVVNTEDFLAALV